MSGSRAAYGDVIVVWSHICGYGNHNNHNNNQCGFYEFYNIVIAVYEVNAFE